MMGVRKSLRLRQHDYSEGVYFITICTQGGYSFFGDMIDGNIVLNDAGKMIQTQWDLLAARFPEVVLDTFVVMPNHVHGIIASVGAPLVGARISNRDVDLSRATTRVAPTPKHVLGDIVGAFKSITTNQYIEGVKNKGWSAFPGKLWLRNYYERIIRNQAELTQTRRYIQENPQKKGVTPKILDYGVSIGF